MGLCYSKAGWLTTSTDTFTDCSELSTSNCNSLLMYDSPRWSADTGDKGKLGTLFYKKRRGRHRHRHRHLLVAHPDLFSARLGGLLHTFQMKPLYSPKDISLASFLGTPFVRSLETPGMDAQARSCAISAATASARNTFLLLQERDRSQSVEVIAPMIKIQTPDRCSGGEGEEGANEITVVEQDEDDDPELSAGEILEVENRVLLQGGVLLDSPTDDDDDEIELALDPSHERFEDSRSSEWSDFGPGELQDINLGAPYKTGITMQRVEQKSFLESCFPATGRWASVVNAARDSACLPRAQSSPASATASAPPRHNCAEERISEEPVTLSECFGLEVQQVIYHQNRHFVFEADRGSGSTESPSSSEAGHACVGCCGSRQTSRNSDNDNCSETRHASRGDDAIAASAPSTSYSSRSVKSETGSCSELLELPQRNVTAATTTLLPEHSSFALHEDMEDRPGDASAMMSSASSSIPGHGLRVTTSQQKVEAGSSQHQIEVIENLEPPLERVDSDLDSFFSFPSSPSAKALLERGSGHIIEEMKSAKLREMMQDDSELRGEDELEGPRSRAESPRGGNALSKGAFGSPFPVLGASGRNNTTRPVLEKKLKLFSLERANTAALAKKLGSANTSISDGVLTSSSTESYLDSSSSNMSRPSDTIPHDWDELNSDLFEIQDMQPPVSTLKSFPGVGVALSTCLPIRTSSSFGCCPEACDRFSDAESSATSCDSRALKYQVRGANAVRGADSRAKLLREQATKNSKAKSEEGRAVSGPAAGKAKEPSAQNKGKGKDKSKSKGISVLVLSLLRRRTIESNAVAAGSTSGSQEPMIPQRTNLSSSDTKLVMKLPTRSTSSTGKNYASSAATSAVVTSSFEFCGKSITALSIRDVLERQELQERRHAAGHPFDLNEG